MEYILDNENAEKMFQDLIQTIPAYKNGIVADSLNKSFPNCYKMNYGVSTDTLANMANKYKYNHVLSLKLWNKGWRETYILALMIEDSQICSPKQMDYWVKTAPSMEIIEQGVMHIFSKIDNRFQKCIEWSLEKKLNVKKAGLLLMGRLALIESKEFDSEFEVFLQDLAPLTKDSALHNQIINVIIRIAKRDNELFQLSKLHADSWTKLNNDASNRLAKAIIEELSYI